VDREYRIALNAQLVSGTWPKILPLLIEEVQLPAFLRDIKYADFSRGYESALDELLKTLKRESVGNLGHQEFSVTSQDEKFMEELKAVIEKNLSNQDFSIDILCKILLIGRSTLFRKVEKITGKTPNEYIKSYRLERAAQLLKENHGNVSEVSEAVGFFTPQYFAKCFKEKFGQSPKGYRLSHEEDTPASKVKANIEFTLEELGRELVLRLPLPKLKKLFKSKMGNPQISEIYESIKNFYDSDTTAASNKALKDMTLTELMQKMQMNIDDLKEDAFR
jgi:AraC-like DNA-binding protein